MQFKRRTNQATQNKLSIIDTYETTSIATLEMWYQKTLSLELWTQINADLNLPEEFISLVGVNNGSNMLLFSKPQKLH